MELTLISLVTFFTFYKTLNFYFWFDDFTMFYAAKLNECPLDWPFNSYCNYMNILYSFIGDNPMPYFLLAVFLRILMGYSFYFFVKRYLTSSVALLLSFLVVSLAGFDSMMAFYSISSSMGLSLLFLTLGLIDSHKNISLMTFAFSLVVFPIYSTAHIFPSLLKLFESYKKNIVYILLFLLVTFATYFLIPYRQTGKINLILERTNTKSVILLDLVKQKSLDYFYTSSHFIIPEVIEWKYLTKVNSTTMKSLRILVGVILNSIFVVLGIFYRRNKTLAWWCLLSFVTLLTQYIPRGFVTTGGFGTHDRHMLYPYVGFAMLFGLLSFVNKKVFYIIGIILVLFNIYQSNIFLSKYVDINDKRAIFYKDLKNELLDKIIKPNTILFIDSPQGSANHRLGDFIRSGTLPSESSIAFALGVNYRHIKVITESSRLSKMLAAGQITPENFYSFYFSGDKLINTTNQARKNLFEKNSVLNFVVNKEINTNIFFDDTEMVWKGTSDDLEFNTNGFVGVVPSKMSLQLKAELLDFPLPYSQCINKKCTKSAKSVSEIASFIYESNQIKKDALVDVSNLDETTYASNLLDNIYNNRWNADRSKWFTGEKPEITITFSEKQRLSGFFLTTTTSSRKPIQIEVYGDEKPIDCKLIDIESDLIKLTCASNEYRKIKLKIIKTTVEVPSIDEIDFIPTGYGNIDFDEINKFKTDPFAHVISNEEKLNLKMFGQKIGSDICLEWKDENDNTQRVLFPILFDGLTRTYNVKVPAVGINHQTFNIGCINYPLNISLQKVGVSFVQ